MAGLQHLNYWSLVEPVWLPLNRSWDLGPQLFVHQFRAVQTEIGHLYAAHWCQSEVRNGGLHQFFWNTTGILAPEALDGFKAIGAANWSDVLAEALEHFGTPYPRERDDRLPLLAIDRGRPRDEWDPFRDLDERFYKSESDWQHIANAYAERFIKSRPA